MTDFAATALATVQGLQLAFQVIYALAITAFRYPPNCAITNGTYYDFIIVGGGTAGSILANRLSANSAYNVLMIEAGGYAPLESDMAGLFPFLTSSVYDFNITSENDNRTSQNLQNQVMELTAGKMLGGSGSLDHMMHLHGSSRDYNNWADIIGDDSWNYTNIMPFMKKHETLADKELISTEYASLHGTDGPIKIARQRNSDNNKIFEAAAELGHRVVPDLSSDTCTVGITEPLYATHNNLRQSSAVSYLNETISRQNLCVALYTTGIKILIVDGVAVGVRAVDSDGNIYEVYAKKEVIISAGTINSPKILMNSGIGPKTHLEANNISVVTDLPVGENYQDHPSLVLVYLLDNDNTTAPPFNPYLFPAPVTVLYGAVNRSQTYADYQAIILQFPKQSTSMLQLCSHVIKYKNDICNKFYEASANRSLIFVVFGLTMPKSRGYVRLASSDYNDKPLVYPNFYTDSENADLELMAQSVADFDNITSTKYFQSVNSTLVDLGFCSDATTDIEFWKCYAIEMSIGMWHYVGTSAMGTCLDSSLRVKNIEKLRVIDASSMPTEIRGKPRAAVNMIAERGSHLILSYWNITV